MLADVVTATTEWLTATGAPNGVVILALLTSPATWSEHARGALGKALDRAGLGGDPEAAQSGSQDEQ